MTVGRLIYECDLQRNINELKLLEYIFIAFY